MANRGYVCFAINYRLAPEHKSWAKTEDYRDAVLWVRLNGPDDKADLNRIGTMGYPAGGRLVSMLATNGLGKEENPEEIRASLKSDIRLIQYHLMTST